MSERGDDALEVAALGMLQARKNILEGRTESSANDLRALEEIEGVDPGGRKGRRFDRLRVALDGRPRIDLVGNTVAHAGKDGRDHEVGIGVGAGDAMRDAGRRAGVAGNAEGPGGGVDGPRAGPGD